MAKLSDLKTLLRSAGSKPAPRGTRAARELRQARRRPHARTPTPTSTSSQAFADVAPLPSSQPRAHRQGAARADAGQAAGRRSRRAGREQIRHRAVAVLVGYRTGTGGAADVSAHGSGHRRARPLAARPLGGAGRARSAPPDQRRGARRARRFPVRCARPRLALRARHSRQGSVVAEPRAGAQEQGAPLAVAMGRGARLLRSAAPWRRWRRRGRPAQGSRQPESSPAQPSGEPAMRQGRQVAPDLGDPRSVDVADDDARAVGQFGHDGRPTDRSARCARRCAGRWGACRPARRRAHSTGFRWRAP